MTEALELISWLLLVGGAVFCVIGGVGLHRLPDFYARTHASSVTDTLGAGLILTGLMVQAGLTLVTVKLVMVLVFLWVTSPTAGHALAKAAYGMGERFSPPQPGGQDAD